MARSSGSSSARAAGSSAPCNAYATATGSHVSSIPTTETCDCIGACSTSSTRTATVWPTATGAAPRTLRFTMAFTPFRLYVPIAICCVLTILTPTRMSQRATTDTAAQNCTSMNPPPDVFVEAMRHRDRCRTSWTSVMNIPL